MWLNAIFFSWHCPLNLLFYQSALILYSIPRVLDWKELTKCHGNIQSPQILQYWNNGFIFCTLTLLEEGRVSISSFAHPDPETFFSSGSAFCYVQYCKPEKTWKSITFTFYFNFQISVRKTFSDIPYLLLIENNTT